MCNYYFIDLKLNDKNTYFSIISFIFSGILAHLATISMTFDLVIVFLFEMGSSESV